MDKSRGLKCLIWRLGYHPRRGEPPQLVIDQRQNIRCCLAWSPAEAASSKWVTSGMEPLYPLAGLGANRNRLLSPAPPDGYRPPGGQRVSQGLKSFLPLTAEEMGNWDMIQFGLWSEKKTYRTPGGFQIGSTVIYACSWSKWADKIARETGSRRKESSFCTRKQAANPSKNDRFSVGEALDSAHLRSRDIVGSSRGDVFTIRRPRPYPQINPLPARAKITDNAPSKNGPMLIATTLLRFSRGSPPHTGWLGVCGRCSDHGGRHGRGSPVLADAFGPSCCHCRIDIASVRMGLAEAIGKHGLYRNPVRLRLCLRSKSPLGRSGGRVFYRLMRRAGPGILAVVEGRQALLMATV